MEKAGRDMYLTEPWLQVDGEKLHLGISNHKLISKCSGG